MPPRYLSLTVASLAVGWIAALLVVGWLVHAGRHVAREREQGVTAALATVVDQQVARTLQATYLTLGAIRDSYHLYTDPRPNDREFQALMTARLKDLPFLRALFIVGNDGWIIHDTDYPKTPHVSLADRPYFSAYAQDPAGRETAWPPIQSRSGTGWFMPVTRALGPPERFEGVVVAALQASHFEEQFHAVGLPRGYVVTLFHESGVLVASYPRVGEVGRDYRGRLPLFARLPQARHGTLWTDDSLLPGRRLVSFRALDVAPFVVRVSRGEDEIYAEWRRTATAAAVAMAGLTLLLAVFILRLVRDEARRAREVERRNQAEKLEALGSVSGGMAHDFANLLAVIGTNVEIARTNPSDPAVIGQVLDTIERTVGTGTHIARRLLAFARRQPLTLTRVHLDACLEAARPLLRNAAGTGVVVDIECEPGLPAVLCDVRELDVALVNLLVNARDAMGQTGRVSVRAFRCPLGRRRSTEPPIDAAYVCLSVRDEGPGMPEEVRQRIFEPFYTTKGSAGTGLGLAQVYGFMRQIGGDAGVESAPGRGTTVHLYFPVAPSEGAGTGDVPPA
jgi:signal transduction histidine kinase